MKEDMFCANLTDDVDEWLLEHIRKGVEAARGGEFATDAEVEEFFRRYGNAFSNGADYTVSNN